MILSLGIILGIIAMVSFGISKVSLKKLILSVGEYSSILYSNSLLVFFLFIAAVFLADFRMPSFNIFCLTAALGFVGAISLFLFMKAMKIGQVAVVVPITSGFGIIIVMLAIVILKESLSLAVMSGILLVIIGTVLISFRYSEFKKIKGRVLSSSGIGISLLVAVGWGIYYFFLKFVSVELGSILAAVYVESSVLFFILILVFSNRDKLKKPHGRDYLYIFLNGFFIAVASIAYYTGITVSSISVVGAITSAAPLVSSLLAVVMLKERIELNQKIATFIIVAGLVMLSI